MTFTGRNTVWFCLTSLFIYFRPSFPPLCPDGAFFLACFHLGGNVFGPDGPREQF